MNWQMQNYADRLRAARKKLNLSRPEAGEIWGLNWRTIEAWEQGVIVPRGLYRERLEEILRPIE
jgi:DNA-binding transcriptional regulator YiaG